MKHFNYQQNALWVDDVPVANIIASVGTPCYIYSNNALLASMQRFTQAFHAHPHTLCYAVKANGNLAILQSLAAAGSGFDIVSGGELARVLHAGGQANKVIFSGVGKTAEEIRFALQEDIQCFNVESPAELMLIQQIAQDMHKTAPIAFRVNPNVDPLSHPYISTGLKESKFGIAWEEVLPLYEHAQSLSHIHIKGIACHIGSQLTTLAPFVEATQKLLSLIAPLQAKGIALSHIDIGGGLGICYQNETPPPIEAYAKAITARVPTQLPLIIEPGRAIVGNAGILVTQVLYLKNSGEKHFCIVDTAMNDLIRPALYEAWHDIIPVVKESAAPTQHYDIVGPVCESADFLGKDRALNVKAGDLLAICSVGAYGFVNSSNYTGRPRICEVMVKENTFKVVRTRETIAQMFEQEKLW